MVNNPLLNLPAARSSRRTSTVNLLRHPPPQAGKNRGSIMSLRRLCARQLRRRWLSRLPPVKSHPKRWFLTGPHRPQHERAHLRQARNKIPGASRTTHPERQKRRQHRLLKPHLPIRRRHHPSAAEIRSGIEDKLRHLNNQKAQNQPKEQRKGPPKKAVLVDRYG